MVGEFNVYGVFIPALLVWMAMAFCLTALFRQMLVRLQVYRVVWHRSLFNLALYVVILGGVVSVVPRFLS